MRRITKSLLLCVVIWFTAGPVWAETAPILPARAYLLMDAGTGRVLYEHEGYRTLPIASTTKVMTAIIALERGNLSDVVTVGYTPYVTGGSTIYLELGEKQTLENLLYALMLESANDAGVAIAEHLAGTEAEFARWMTARAHELQAASTKFSNSHGLYDPNHYSTAYDLALITRHALQNPTFREIITSPTKEIPGFGPAPPRQLQNRNRLLGYYEGANGVKNGFTEESGLTNIASARRGDLELIAVVLGASTRLWSSSMALLDFGFDRFETRLVVQEGEQVAIGTTEDGRAITAVAAEPLYVTLSRISPEPQRQVEWSEPLRAPLAKGDRVGRLQLLERGTLLATVDLLAGEALELTAADSSVSRPSSMPSAAADSDLPSADPVWPTVAAVLSLLGLATRLTLSLHAIRLPTDRNGSV